MRWLNLYTFGFLFVVRGILNEDLGKKWPLSDPKILMQIDPHKSKAQETGDGIADCEPSEIAFNMAQKFWTTICLS
jgi:hypothetical protein